VSGPKVAVFYATREGHCARVANRIADVLRRRGFEPRVENVGELAAGVTVEHYGGAILIASVHAGQHEPEMVAFIRRERESLTKMPSASRSRSAADAALVSRSCSSA